MGLAERDYTRRTSGGSGLNAIREWSATTWLMAIALAAFVLDALLTPPFPAQFMAMSREPAGPEAMILYMLGPIARLTHFSRSTVIEHLQLWRVATFPLVHTEVWPVFINAVCLYLFARPMEAEIGTRRFVALFAACCLAAPATYLLLNVLGFRIIEPWLPLAGMTGGVLGVVVAAACAGPNDEVVLWSASFTVPRRTLAWIAAAIVMIVAIKQDPSGAGAAHLGGAVVGLLAVPLVRRPLRIAR